MAAALRRENSVVPETGIGALSTVPIPTNDSALELPTVVRESVDECAEALSLEPEYQSVFDVQPTTAPMIATIANEPRLRVAGAGAGSIVVAIWLGWFGYWIKNSATLDVGSRLAPGAQLSRVFKIPFAALIAHRRVDFKT
jgi:hypothetical protein